MMLRRPPPTKGKLFNAAAESPRIDYNREKPTFCLRYVDTQYCITICQNDDKAAFADKIRRMSQMTWNELIQAPRHGMGLETIPAYRIERPRPRHLTDDVTLIAFASAARRRWLAIDRMGRSTLSGLITISASTPTTNFKLPFTDFERYERKCQNIVSAVRSLIRSDP
jgi:hypothetical protein